MLIFALVIAAPTPLTDTHQRDISCVVEIAVLADAQRRGAAAGDIAVSGKRWAGSVGDRIFTETGQPRELVAVAMTEAAKARAGGRSDIMQISSCIMQMKTELAIADAADAPLPKPVKAQ